MEFMSLCDRVVVLNFGQKIAEGSSEEVRQNEDVIQAYFGSEHAA
jgi:branched-chain amino acid transport system ATP-binding protein